MRLLLVEDDDHLGSGLKKGLERAGYSVEWLRNGEDGLHAACTGGFDAMVLDVNLPGISGIDVMTRLRSDTKAKALPTLMLTAMDGVDNIVRGLDAGAHDYLTKPFDFKELLARLRVLTRKGSDQEGRLLRCGDIELDLAGKLAKKDGEPLALTARELRLLAMLMARPGHIVSKSEIEEELYGWEGDIDSNTVEVVVYNLRRKLGKDAIITLRGMGYRMRL